MGDLAFWLRFSPEEIGRLRLSDFLRWHEQAGRVAREYHQ